MTGILVRIYLGNSLKYILNRKFNTFAFKEKIKRFYDTILDKCSHI
jgi:hypothetical protein